MVEKQSEIGRDAQFAMLQQHKWQAEIEQAVDKVKLGVVPGRKRTKTDKWFRKQWFRAMMRDRKTKARDGKALTGLKRRALEHPEWQDEPFRKY
jgi:short-subunit dehydrogenase